MSLSITKLLKLLKLPCTSVYLSEISVILLERFKNLISPVVALPDKSSTKSPVERPKTQRSPATFFACSLRICRLPQFSKLCNSPVTSVAFTHRHLSELQLKPFIFPCTCVWLQSRYWSRAQVKMFSMSPVIPKKQLNRSASMSLGSPRKTLISPKTRVSFSLISSRLLNVPSTSIPPEIWVSLRFNMIRFGHTTKTLIFPSTCWFLERLMHSIFAPNTGVISRKEICSPQCSKSISRTRPSS
mmetsp:Transcript_60606/g.83174  ORF Transcript_60606/g.83174 Transcript_60606/m.83174 type:complete len:243 (+) Transcript_60606:580-1308(+)